MVNVQYLFDDDGIPQREYALDAASDGVITYSYSDGSFYHRESADSKRWSDAFTTDNPVAADTEQSLWIESIFKYIDSVTGVSFKKTGGTRGELHLNFVPTKTNKYLNDDLSDPVPQTQNQWTGGLAFKNGYGQMYSFHNRKQYGGLDDIRSIQRAILEAIGLTPPHGDPFHPDHSWDNTLLSNNFGGRKSAGATFFLASDDKMAIKKLLGERNQAEPLPKKIIHNQKGKENLLIGTDGVKDIFKLKSKGMILKEDYGTQYNINGPLINNYNCNYIANFNPYEGDKIKIHRSLLHPKSPQHKDSRKLAKRYKKTDLKFKQIYGDTYKDDKNIYYNDAGKLLVDTNGLKDGVISFSSKHHGAGLNGQIVAFIDPVGPETDIFLGEWLSLFG